LTRSISEEEPSDGLLSSEVSKEERDIVPITLQDPARKRDPLSTHAFREVVAEPKLRIRPTLAEEILAGSRKKTTRAR
jgi:hypothetical protein